MFINRVLPNHTVKKNYREKSNFYLPCRVCKGVRIEILISMTSGKYISKFFWYSYSLVTWTRYSILSSGIGYQMSYLLSYDRLLLRLSLKLNL